MYPQASYLIFATPRSGSYMLCEALTNTGLAGRPMEFFTPMQAKALITRWKVADYADYLNQTLTRNTSPNGVFGAKFIWRFFEDFLDEVRAMPGYKKMLVPDLLAAIFPHVRYIAISRRDKVRQAVSYWKALQSGIWANIDGVALTDWDVLRPGTPEFDFRGIDLLLREALRDETEMHSYFQNCGVEPLAVVYEDLIEHYAESVTRILHYLDIPLPTTFEAMPPKMRQQSDAQSDHWVSLYHHCRQEHEARYGPHHQWPRYTMARGILAVQRRRNEHAQPPEAAPAQVTCDNDLPELHS